MELNEIINTINAYGFNFWGARSDYFKENENNFLFSFNEIRITNKRKTLSRYAAEIFADFDMQKFSLCFSGFGNLAGLEMREYVAELNKAAYLVDYLNRIGYKTITGKFTPDLKLTGENKYFYTKEIEK